MINESLLNLLVKLPPETVRAEYSRVCESVAKLHERQDTLVEAMSRQLVSEVISE